MSSDTSECGALRWKAPELFDGAAPTQLSDVYSFAITAWELLTGKVPFSDVSDSFLPSFVSKSRGRPVRPDLLLNEAVWILMRKCWDSDPSERPPFWSIHSTLKPFVLQRAHCSFSGVIGVPDSYPQKTWLSRKDQRFQCLIRTRSLQQRSRFHLMRSPSR